MVSRRDEAREQRRRQILDAAALVIGEKGYFGFGLQELAASCGVTKAAVLYHFETKEVLLLAVLRDRDERDVVAVQRALGIDDADQVASPSLELIRTTLLAIVERNLQRPELVRLFAVVRAEALNPLHPAHCHMANRDAATLRLFQQMLAPHIDRSDSVGRQLHATIHGLELQWMQELCTFDLLEEWREQMTRILGNAAKS